MDVFVLVIVFNFLLVAEAGGVKPVVVIDFESVEGQSGNLHL